MRPHLYYDDISYHKYDPEFKLDFTKKLESIQYSEALAVTGALRVTEAWFPLVLRIIRIGDSYDFPTLGFLRLLRFLGQPGYSTPNYSETLMNMQIFSFQL